MAEQHLGSEDSLFFSFPDQTCAGCSVLHFHFRRNQPIYRKAQPAPEAVRVFTVRAGFLFQKHLSERNRILFSVPALCAAALRSHQRPSRFPSLQELLGVRELQVTEQHRGKGPEGPDGKQDDHEPALYPCCQEGKWHPGVY